MSRSSGIYGARLVSSAGGVPPALLSIPAATAQTIASCDELNFSSDSQPGISRRRAGRGFAYFDADGRRIVEPETLARIRTLAIPPAYRDVWICADPRGHLQATGIDARGRKQPRYHALWRSVRDAHKFERMLDFGRALPRIHRRVGRDLQLPGMSRDKVVAAVVRLLESTLIRVGNAEYARDNGSYGLTTLRNRHVAVRGSRMRFRFRGKHGIRHEIEVDDPRAAKVVRRCLDLPGQELFVYVDDEGEVRNIGSSDVNLYLKETTGQDFTAKDFRTWYATSEALETLAGRQFETPREAQVALKGVLAALSRKLGNTPAMCRKCYVNPAVVDAYLAGELSDSNLRGGASERSRLLRLLMRTSGDERLRRTLRASIERAGKARVSRRANAAGAPTS